jgi:antitoxin HicB
MTSTYAYASRLEQLPSEEGGYWVVSFPDIPGCLGVGDTAAEAEADAQTALAACLDAFKAIDRAPPIPSELPA